MGSSPSNKGDLAPLQREVLQAFHRVEKGFFLTGGAALAGYHLHHRTTSDLDLFTVDPAAFERGQHTLAEVAAALGAKIETRQDAPGFRRAILSRGDDAVVVDLVLDRSVQRVSAKPEIDGVRVDPPEEILANKLTTLVGRTEERDLVDVLELERAGYRVEDALEAALAKDGGCTPATLAWLLSQIEIPDSARLPAGVAPAELRAFLSDLVVRLLKAAAP